ncbi:MAG: hypothetical protein WHT06_12780 [Desulfobacterales bacterium]
MNKRLYIGNLAAEITANDLTHNFSTVGTVVSAVIIKERYSNQSKGFGFVEMGTEEEARQAIETFNGGELQGRKIIVSEAREPRRDGEPGRPGGFGRGPQGGGGGRGSFGRGGRF